MHPAIIMGTVRSLWTWLWGRHHVPRNIFLLTPVCIYVGQKAKNNTQNTREIICAGEAWSQNSLMKLKTVQRHGRENSSLSSIASHTCLQQRIECPLLESASLYVSFSRRQRKTKMRSLVGVRCNSTGRLSSLMFAVIPINLRRAIDRSLLLDCLYETTYLSSTPTCIALDGRFRVAYKCAYLLI